MAMSTAALSAFACQDGLGLWGRAAKPALVS